MIIVSWYLLHAARELTMLLTYIENIDVLPYIDREALKIEPNAKCKQGLTQLAQIFA